MLKNDSDILRDYCEVMLRLAREREGGDKETPSEAGFFEPNRGGCSTLHRVKEAET